MRAGVDVREDDIAWDLLDRHGRCLTVSERHAVSISLATDEHQRAIHDILAAALREQDPPAPALLCRLVDLIRVYECGPDLQTLVGEALRAAEADAGAGGTEY